MRFSALLGFKRRPVNPATRDVRPPQVHSKVDGSRGKLSMNQTKRQEKRQAIHTAIKRVAVKGSAERDEAPVKPARPFVFVGNLTSTITVPRLQALFAPCGEIIEILVRCSRGKAVTAGGPAQHDALNVRDLWYASMTFRDLPAAEEALTFTGLEIDGRNIVVCKTAVDLPEVLDFAHIRFGQNQEKRGMINQYRRIPRRLAAEPTEVDNSNDRHRLFGISFAKCLF